MPLLSPGEGIRDTFEVERFLGEGAFAEVYRVRHRFLGRQAMKVFKRPGMTQDEIVEMLGEAILLSKIGHPNIVRVYDANTFELKQGVFGYFTMENVPGGSLEKYWQSHGAQFVPVAEAVEIIKQVCRGISVAHSERPPIIHRDIKPQNILVGYEADGLRARVGDFGLAKKVNPLTLLATAAGTIAFKPPEVFTDTKGDSCAADVWAIGSTLYLLLTDRLPFDLDPDMGWGGRAFDRGVEHPSSINIEVDKALDEIVARCLAKRAADRYATAGDLLDALGRWRPRADFVGSQKSGLTSTASKTVLGAQSPASQKTGERMAQEALALAREARLGDAADQMEEAFNKWPALRERYAERVRLWRCGITM